MGKVEYSREKILWVDLEMTGLNVETEVIIEVAAIVTDFQLQELEQYETTVKQPQEYLDRMDEWNREHHGKSGLISKIPHGRPPHLVEQDLIEIVSRHFPDSKIRPVLAGNSVYHDRNFLEKYFPKLSNLLHYRILDVSSWKVVMQGRYNLEHKKQNKHRATDDIRESIKELKAYLRHFQLS